MAFKLIPAPSFRYPVYLPELSPDGEVIETLVRFDFKRLSSDEQARLQKQNDLAVRLIDALERAKGDKALAFLMMAAEDQRNGVEQPMAADKAKDLLQILHGWEPVDFEGADGPAGFTLAALEQLLQTCPTADAAIRAAFREANNGGKQQEEEKTHRRRSLLGRWAAP